MKVKNEVFMNPPRAVFFDIDRTLYDHRRDFVSPASLAAIAALRTRGIVPAIATGRGYAALPPRIAQLVAARRHNRARWQSPEQCRACARQR